MLMEEVKLINISTNLADLAAQSGPFLDVGRFFLLCVKLAQALRNILRTCALLQDVHPNPTFVGLAGVLSGPALLRRLNFEVNRVKKVLILSVPRQVPSTGITGAAHGRHYQRPPLLPGGGGGQSLLPHLERQPRRGPVHRPVEVRRHFPLHLRESPHPVDERLVTLNEMSSQLSDLPASFHFQVAFDVVPLRPQHSVMADRFSVHFGRVQFRECAAARPATSAQPLAPNSEFQDFN